MEEHGLALFGGLAGCLLDVASEAHVDDHPACLILGQYVREATTYVAFFVLQSDIFCILQSLTRVAISFIRRRLSVDIQSFAMVDSQVDQDGPEIDLAHMSSNIQRTPF